MASVPNIGGKNCKLSELVSNLFVYCLYKQLNMFKSYHDAIPLSIPLAT